MFIHSTHLPQLLSADSYHSSDQHDREQSRVFASGWHFIGTVAEVPRVGDYLTRERLSRPLLVYHTSEGIRCFLNVCAHRYSLLTSRPSGHMGTLRCQFHGWEYDDLGRTRKIPDARSFRPMSDGQLGLTSIRTEICGQLIFVCFDPDAVSLAEFLGPAYDRCRTLFSKGRRQMLKRDFDIAVNWKVKVENSLESYHVECVHRRTFGRTPAAENCSHQLELSGSVFTTVEPPASRVHRGFDSIIHGLIGVERDLMYEHHIRYPNFMFGKAGIFTWIEIVVPVARNRSRVTFIMFTREGCRRNPISRLAWYVVSHLGTRFAVRAMKEDFAIVPQVQRGLESVEQPAGGLISIREERVFHFQEYVRAATAVG